MNSPVSSSSTALISYFGNFLCANFAGVTFRRAALTAVSIASWVIELLYTCLLLVLWEVASSSFFFHCVGPPVKVIALASLGVPPLGVAPPLEALLSVISQGLQLVQDWEVVRADGDSTPCVVQIVKLQLLVLM